MEYQIPKWVYLVSSLSILLPIAIGFGRWNRLPNVLRLIPIYSVIFGFIDTLGWLYPRLYMNSNHITGNLMTAVEMGALGWIYYRILQNNISKKIILIALISYVLFFSQQLFANKLAVLNGMLLASASLIMMFAALAGFYDMLQMNTERRLSKLYHFWLHSGVLISFSGSFFSYLYGDKLNQNIDILHMLWYIPLILTIILKILLAVALWVFDPVEDKIST